MFGKLFGALLLALLLMLVAGMAHARDGCTGWDGDPADWQVLSHIAVIDGEVGQPEVMALSFGPAMEIAINEKGIMPTSLINPTVAGTVLAEWGPKGQPDKLSIAAWSPGGVSLAFT